MNWAKTAEDKARQTSYKIFSKKRRFYQFPISAT